MDWLLRDTPSSQLEECMIYTLMFPHGDDWLQAATIASVASASGFKKVIPVDELIPRQRRDEPTEMTEEQFNASVNAMAASIGMMGGR